MAKYKCIPAYEFIRPGVYAQFNDTGDFVTNDEKVIAALDAAGPFIERVDKPEEDAEKEPKTPAKSRAKKTE